MARKSYTPEQSIAMLREAEVRLAGGGKTGSILPGFGRIGAELLPLEA